MLVTIRVTGSKTLYMGVIPLPYKLQEQLIFHYTLEWSQKSSQWVHSHAKAVLLRHFFLGSFHLFLDTWYFFKTKESAGQLQLDSNLIKYLSPISRHLFPVLLAQTNILFSLTYLHLNHSICKKFLCTYVATPFPLNAASLYPSLFIVYRSQDHLKVIETHFGMEPQKQLVV